ncbi:AAA family ATPase [Pauljensenia sp. 27098_8_83]
MSTVHGVVILAQQRYEAPLIQAIQRHGETLAIVRRCADLAEVIAAGRAGIADLAVIDGADPDLTAEAVDALRSCGMAVVALGSHALRPRLVSIGVASVAAPGSPEQVVNSLIAATRNVRVQPAIADEQPPPPPPPSSPGTVIAVWGTSGAPGRTTLAAGIATILARTAPTLLVDADTANPTIAHLLGLPVQASGLSILARTASRGPLTPQDVQSAAVQRSEGLRVITGLVTPHRWREVSRTSIESIIGALRLSARYSVVDIASTSLEKSSRGASRDDAALGVLERVDRLVIVARGDIVGINRLSFLASWWNEHGSDCPITLIVNRVSTDAIGAHPVASLQDAIGTFMPEQVFHVVDEDAGVARAALRGKALGESGTHCKASDELEAIVAQWVPTL